MTPQADRAAIVLIVSRLDEWLHSESSNNNTKRMVSAENALEDILAILHETGAADFGSVGRDAIALRDFRRA